ncbi:MAG: hypothetical protein K0S27_1045 [Gammaproteobacteria bacterium]|jgi:hypothetical protein|nr:hypothetical protein [Gammaproteobacteria bacterium]
MPLHDSQPLLRNLYVLLIRERIREERVIPYIPYILPPRSPRAAHSFSVAQIKQLLSSPKYSIGRCYQVEEKNGCLRIQESSRNPPTEREQARFKQMTNEHFAGKYVARCFRVTVNVEEDNHHLQVPCWEFVLAPTNVEVWNFFKPHFVEKLPDLHEYACQARAKLNPLLSDLKQEEAEKIGSTFQAPLVASLPLIPVSFPDSAEVVFDLCEEILKLIPERDGRVSNPFTRQCFQLKDLQLRQDVVEILADRIKAQQNPSEFFRELLDLQGDNEAVLAEPVKKKLAHLKPSQHQAFSDYVLKGANSESPFSSLLILELVSLGENAVIDEFEARYGIRSQSMKCSDQRLVFSFTNKDYQALLKEYENNPALLPVNYTKKEGNTWEVTLNINEYKQMIQDNEDNVTRLLASFQRYHEHLIHSASSRFKRTTLKQSDLHTKKEETLKLIQALHGSMPEEGSAQKLIAFRKKLPNAAKKLNVIRDEWPWRLMKRIITFLTLGIAHYCCKIWKIEGKEQVRKATDTLQPKPQRP